MITAADILELCPELKRHPPAARYVIADNLAQRINKTAKAQARAIIDRAIARTAPKPAAEALSKLEMLGWSMIVSSSGWANLSKWLIPPIIIAGAVLAFYRRLRRQR